MRPHTNAAEDYPPSYSVLEGAVLREQQDRHAAIVSESSKPVEVNVVRFVQEMLSGAIGDASFDSKGEALKEIQFRLVQHYGRLLTIRERTELVNLVALEWTAREETKAS